MITISGMKWVNNNKSLIDFTKVTSLSDCTNLLVDYNINWVQNTVWVAIACQTFTEIFFYIFMLRLFLIKIVHLSLIEIRIQSVNLMNLAIKHTNLLLLVMTTAYLGLLIFGFGIGTYMLSIDLMINSVAIYLSFEFSDKLYDSLCCSSFCQNNYKCHQCCIYLCWCCCTPTKLPQSVLLELKQMESNLSNKRSNSIHSSPSNQANMNKSDSNNVTNGNVDSIETEEISIEIITNDIITPETSK